MNIITGFRHNYQHRHHRQSTGGLKHNACPIFRESWTPRRSQWVFAYRTIIDYSLERQASEGGRMISLTLEAWLEGHGVWELTMMSV